MPFFKNIFTRNYKRRQLLEKYFKYKTTIYHQVVYIILFLAAFLFVSFGIIFKTVNQEYIKSVIRQNGNNVGLLVDGALYNSMLENDTMALRNMLNIINIMPGIDDVNMYDDQDKLMYSSFSKDTIGHSNPNCIDCHENIKSMFPGKEKSFTIVNLDSECKMNAQKHNHRHLLIRSPILNEKSCYTSACHAHDKSDEVLGSFVIKIPLEEFDADLNKSYILATMTTLILVLLLIFFTRKKIKIPLNAILKVSEAVASGDTKTRLEVKDHQLDDVRIVSIAFNEMLDNLQSASKELQNWSQQLEYKVQKKSEELGQAQNELINIERIASLGKLSLSVAHEINNPLSGILIYTKLIQKKFNNLNIDTPEKGSVLKHLKMIENETNRCGDIVKGLLDFSRKDQNSFEIMHLSEILRQTCNLTDHSMKISKINFLKDFAAENDFVYCNPNQIKQAFIAVIVNATEAVSENGRIFIKTLNPDENHISIEIKDNGSGIAQEDIPHIFEPFFSTKQDAGSTGLGLAIVHGIIQSHDGKIKVKSKPGKGTTISIILPLKEIKDNKNEH